MASVLICWLGKADLRASKGVDQGLGPIAQAATKRTFDELDLLTNDPADEVAGYEKWLKQQFAGTIWRHQSKLPDPTDHRAIYEAAVRALDAIAARYAKKKERPALVFHLSPGTPSMASIWVLLAKTRYPGELIQTAPGRGVYTTTVPFDISAEFIPDLLRTSDADLMQRSAAAPPEAPEFGEIVHRCGAMRAVIGRARKVAFRSVPVLLEGESGTGKELFARAIHNASPRKGKPFVAVNCGAIPKDLVESELFGHKKGAFTGATEARLGHFREANGGTLFLDELGELPVESQVKLLRVLQDEAVTPVGESKAVPVNVRILTATNRTLAREVESGRFREDLFYRLAVAVLRLPPLRERQGDLGPLIEALLDQVNEDATREPAYERKKLSPGARNVLLNHEWPGNVRELRNTIMRCAIWSEGPSITKEDVEQALLSSQSPRADTTLSLPLGDGFDLGALLKQVSRHYIERALKEANGNKTQAAKLVGFTSHQRLDQWKRKLGVDS